jgi:hypothetical protein
MKKKRKVQLTASEQAVLDGVSLRLVELQEQERFDRLIETEHYLHRAEWVGERLFYVAEYQGQWLALLAWTSAAYHLKARDGWIGWDPEQRARRLKLVANNARFLILSEGQPNLASRVMGLCLKRLSADWEARYAHPILVVESFVDGELFRGTSYKVTGWTQLGKTEGYARHCQDYYVRHDRPKQLWVRSLVSGGRKQLRAEDLPAELASVEVDLAPRCTLSVSQLRDMTAYFRRVTDWRKRVVRYPQESLLAVVLCATLCGVVRGQRDLAAFAKTLSTAQRRALRFRKDKKTGKYPAPKETVFFRLLSKTDPLELEQALLGCQEHVLGPQSEEDRLIAYDGKVLRSADGMELVSGYSVNTGRWLGTEAVESKSNEIPAAQRLLQRIGMDGKTTALDALHTQVDTARQIVEGCGADYVLTVKGNQKGLGKTLQQLWDGRKVAFSPSEANRTGGADPGGQPRAD